MNTLREIYDDLVKQYGNATDTVHTFCDKGTDHTYIEFYAQHLEQFRSNVALLEIGIMTGGSLLLWSKYFEKYDLTGIDYSPSWSSPRPFQDQITSNEHIDLHFNANSKSKEFADGFEEQAFDVIIDDGEHDPNTQIATFRNYISKLKSGGLYFIEDLRGETEERMVKTEAEKWCKEKGIDVDFYLYVGNVQERKDDRIILVKRK